MRARNHRVLSLLLTLALILGLCTPVGGMVGRAGAYFTGNRGSGSCGDGTTYLYSYQALTISGTGPMENYTYRGGSSGIWTTAPWSGKTVTSAVVEEGVTAIGAWSFYYRDSTLSIVIPKSVTWIGSGNDGLRTVYYAGSQEDWAQITLQDPDTFQNATIHYNSTGPEDTGNGGTESPATAIPTPILESADYASGQVTVTWSRPLNNLTTTYTVDGYYVLRKTGSGSYQKLADVGSQETYSDTSVESGQTYTYTVQAYYQGQTGDYDTAGLTVTAQDPSGVLDDLSYEIIDGKAVITDCRETATQVAIPAQIEGCPVVQIGPAAFQDCGKLTSVTLPDCLTVVGDYAFTNCTSLTAIDLTHVVSIGKNAFGWCRSLDSILCGPDLVGLGERALSGSSSLVVTGYVRTPAELQCSQNSIEFRYIPSQVTSVSRGTFEYPNTAGETAAYTFYYNDSFFSYNNAAYHNDLAVMSLKLAMTGYSRVDLYTEQLDQDDLRRALNLQHLFSDMGFGNALYRNYNVALTDSSSKVAYGFASKQIGQDVVVAVVLRGGGYGAEWADNFNVGASGDHKGFSTAAKGVQADLEAYIAGLKDLYQFSGEVKLWMTGYSRSAATCNLLAQAMSSQIAKDNLYAYVFAAPTCTTSPKACQGLYSILSGADLVPCVPLSQWGFGRHGTTLTFPSVLPANRKDEFEALSGLSLGSDEPVTYLAQLAAIQQTISSLGAVISSRSVYHTKYSDLLQQSLKAYFGTTDPSYTAGETLENGLAISALLATLPVDLPSALMLDGIARAHDPAHYLAWLESNILTSVSDFDASGKMVQLSAGVNAQIKNAEGKILATVRNGSVTATSALSGLQIEYAEGQTTFLLSDGSYTLEVYGAGSGSISILELASDSTIQRSVQFANVTLKSTTMALAIRADGQQESYQLQDGSQVIRPTSDTGGSQPSTPAFTDVPANAYYADAVDWAVQEGITNGTGANTFSPESACTRAQAVTFLWRAAGSPAPQSSRMPFTDVPANAYYRDAVLWAVEQNITTGTGASTFSPDDTCTRAQIVTFLWRADDRSPQLTGPVGFGDVRVGDYFWFPVKWALETGITTGTGANTFSPNDTCTRAQIVTFLYRAYA